MARGHPKMALGATVRNTEPRHHLVEHQQCTILIGEVPETNQELLCGSDEPVEAMAKKQMLSNKHQTFY